MALPFNFMKGIAQYAGKALSSKLFREPSDSRMSAKKRHSRQELFSWQIRLPSFATRSPGKAVEGFFHFRRPRTKSQLALKYLSASENALDRSSSRHALHISVISLTVEHTRRRLSGGSARAASSDSEAPLTVRLCRRLQALVPGTSFLGDILLYGGDEKLSCKQSVKFWSSSKEEVFKAGEFHLFILQAPTSSRACIKGGSTVAIKQLVRGPQGREQSWGRAYGSDQRSGPGISQVGRRWPLRKRHARQHVQQVSGSLGMACICLTKQQSVS
jgi:hypothetical protein